jgi:hypothetical protein
VSGGGPGALTSIVVAIVQFSLYKIWDDLHMVPYFCDE